HRMVPARSGANPATAEVDCRHAREPGQRARMTREVGELQLVVPMAGGRARVRVDPDDEPGRLAPVRPGRAGPCRSGRAAGERQGGYKGNADDPTDQSD